MRRPKIFDFESEKHIVFFFCSTHPFFETIKIMPPGALQLACTGQTDPFAGGGLRRREARGGGASPPTFHAKGSPLWGRGAGGLGRAPRRRLLAGPRQKGRTARSAEGLTSTAARPGVLLKRAGAPGPPEEGKRQPRPPLRDTPLPGRTVQHHVHMRTPGKRRTARSTIKTRKTP